jgi:hypothetical protein
MAVPNEVKFNIYHNVLLLKVFTIPQLEAITGLNRRSIYTVIRRMKDEGHVAPVGRLKTHGEGGGAPAVRYEITSDADKRVKLVQSVRAFYISGQPRRVEHRRPGSKHYAMAMEMLDEVVSRGRALTAEQKAAHLASIKQRLEYARREEVAGAEGTELIAACLDVVEAKATHALSGERWPALRSLEAAGRVCKRFGAEDLAAQVESYVQDVVDGMTEEQRGFDARGMYDEVEAIAKDLHAVGYLFGDLAGIKRSVGYAAHVAARARDRQISALAEDRASQQIRVIAAALNDTLRILVVETKCALAEVSPARRPSLEFSAVYELYTMPRRSAEQAQLMGDAKWAPRHPSQLADDSRQVHKLALENAM